MKRYASPSNNKGVNMPKEINTLAEEVHQGALNTLAHGKQPLFTLFSASSTSLGAKFSSSRIIQ